MEQQTAERKNVDVQKEQTEILQLIYKNVKMGSEAIISLLPKVKNTQLRSDITEQMAQYDKYAATITDRLSELGEEPKWSIIDTFPLKAGITMNTLADSSDSHIAEMMIQGSNMGIIDIVKKLNAYGEDADITEVETELNLLREVMKFEEDCVQKLKKYL